MEQLNRHKKFFDAAYAVALASPGVGGKKHNTFRLGAVIVSNQKQIKAARFNSLKTHPKLLPYFEWPYCHAEAHAIISLGLDNCADTSIYVCRILRDNSLALAKPCSNCFKLIKDVGIKSIYYTSFDGYREIHL